MRLSLTLALVAGLAAVAVAQPSYPTMQQRNYSNPANSFSMQNSLPDPYGRNIAPYFNNQEVRLPNQAWSGHVGELVRQGDGGLWIVNTSGLMPKGSTVSIMRNGLMVNGGQVVESGAGTALIKPWASSDVKGGDNVYLQSVAPVAIAPVYDKFQVNRPTMQDPSYLYYTDYMHQEHPGQFTSLFSNFNGFGYYPGYNNYYYRR
ncbi:hypothetical protein JST97_30890 [bacterium]|nr:hypothetical protein [bacterium]